MTAARASGGAAAPTRAVSGLEMSATDLEVLRARGVDPLEREAGRQDRAGPRRRQGVEAGDGERQDEIGDEGGEDDPREKARHQCSREWPTAQPG
jgi:hypothetical protein